MDLEALGDHTIGDGVFDEETVCLPIKHEII